MRIILDTMGGDNGSREFIKGALCAIDELDVDIIFVGDEQEIKKHLGETEEAESYSRNISIINASEVVGMNDDPVSVMKQKPDASMTVALRALAEGKGDAVVSAGNTGALLTQATLIVKRIKGIRRAALCPMIPTAKRKALLIDSGANVECTPEYLLQFALLGSYYMENARKVKRPKVGLLNNGAEEHKGDTLHKEAYKLLAEAGDKGEINFIGNVEGRDVPLGKADVVVCDGFSGNVLLKTMEGVATLFSRELKNIFMVSKRAKFSALMVRKGINEFKKKMDYNEAGGAPLLGIRKPIIKIHGSSSSVSVFNAIKQSIDYIDSGLTIRLSKSLAEAEENGEQ